MFDFEKSLNEKEYTKIIKTKSRRAHSFETFLGKSKFIQV